MSKRKVAQARGALRIDLAKHLKDEHAWRPDACRGFDYMVAGHASRHPDCEWRNLNKALAQAVREA